MPEYVYKAITKEGVIVRNKVESSSKQKLIQRLKSGNLTPIDIVQIGYGKKRKGANIKKKNVTDIDEVMKQANSASIVQARRKKKANIN